MIIRFSAIIIHIPRRNFNNDNKYKNAKNTNKKTNNNALVNYNVYCKNYHQLLYYLTLILCKVNNKFNQYYYTQ